MPSGFNMDDLDRAALFCLACVMYVGTGRLGFYFSHASTAMANTSGQSSAQSPQLIQPLLSIVACIDLPPLFFSECIVPGKRKIIRKGEDLPLFML